MLFERSIKLENIETSVFLFGPRMTGKTTILKKLPAEAFFDLLDPVLELEYKANPGIFWEQITALPENSTIIVDEIQKVPILLNYIQMGIDRHRHIFIISGSSARKLKRGGANLLGGRALDLKLHPLTYDELGDFFSIDRALEFGTIPKIYDLIIGKKFDLVKSHLKSYFTTYIKEEIQAEALTRNIGAFQRFINIAAQSNGQVIEFANISRDCSVPASTVKEYYQILEDTLLGFFLWPYDKSERKKARPKFYFFDPGVVRAIQNRLNDPPLPRELGFLFENWFIAELIRLRDYYNKEHQFSFWRYKNNEIDVIISDGRGPILSIECKAGNTDMKSSTLKAYKDRFPGVPLIIASLRDKMARRVGDIEILPWKQAVEVYKKL
jgi:predicted AAA+ superfamily ATPase